MSSLNANIEAAMQQAVEQCKDNKDGENASYIPFLSSVPSELIGLAFVSVTGEVIKIQDADYKYALESISKVLTLALALEQSGDRKSVV